jgi:peptidoglycan/LPS O-acetylase OafA/YrhL
VIDKPHRYQAFDSLRAIAALIVLLIHAQMLFGFYVPKLPWPLSGLLDSKAAVAFFFVLSGFVLHLSFSKTPLSFVSFAGFQIRRILRIYPLYYLSLLAIIAAVYLQDKSAFPHFVGDGGGATNVLSANHGDLRQWLQQLLLIGPGFDMYFLNPPAWTLAVEMRVAIIFPFLSSIISGLSFGKGAIFLGVSLPLALIAGKLTGLGFIDLIPLFLMGAFFAQHRGAILKMKIYGSQIFVLSALSLVLYSSRTSVRGLPGVGWFVCGLGALGFLLVALRSVTVARILSRPVLSFLGELSYGIYILHFAVLLALSTQASKFHSQSVMILVAFGLLSVVGISFLLYHAIEKPFIELGRKLSEKLRGNTKIICDAPKASSHQTTVG